MSEETEIAERMFADFNRAGFEAITWGVHPEVECVPFAGWPGPSIYRGLNGWAELAAEWTENFDEYGFEVDRVIPIQAGALVLVTQRGRIKGEEDWISMPLAAIWSDFENGRARSVRWFRSWDDGLQAAGLHELATVPDSVEANLALARRGNELWNTGGVDASVEHIWASDITFYEASEFPDAGVFRGAEAVAAHSRNLIDALGHFQFEVRSLEGRGAYVLAALEVKGEGASSGAAVATSFFQVSRYEDGRVLELRSYLDRDRARREYERFSAPGD